MTFFPRYQYGFPELENKNTYLKIGQSNLILLRLIDRIPLLNRHATVMEYQRFKMNSSFITCWKEI